MEETPNLSLPYIMPAQAQKHVTHNEALRMLDALVHLTVQDNHRTEPPLDASEGDRHIVGAGATGDWHGHDLAIALSEGGQWVFMTPRIGWIALIRSKAALRFWDGTEWAGLETIANSTLQNILRLGIGTSADQTNPFAARLNKALWTARYDDEGGDGDLRYTLNKQGTAKVLSLLMQSDWSGRAELGLIGDDDLVLKVSADGAAWSEAIRVDRTDGKVAFAQTGAISAIVRNQFHKDDQRSAVLARTGAGTLALKAGTIVEVAGFLHVFSTDTAVTMPTLAAGTDYAVYVCHDGVVCADASFSAPAGYSTGNSRRIGGFHYAPGGNATGTFGGNTTPQINEHSIWDLKWRPSCPDPRGMTLVADAFWCDIYLLGVNHHIDGTSRNNVAIADGAAPPKVPHAFGGNGSTAYAGLTWYNASEVMKSHGKGLMDYAEFAAAAYGTTENVSRGNDPITTGLGTTNAGSSTADQAFTSRWGVIQAAGCVWNFGRDLLHHAGSVATVTSFTDLVTFTAKAQTGGRGQIFTQTPGHGIAVSRLGGSWDATTFCGSLGAIWNGTLWGSNANAGARGRADHVTLL